MKLKEIKNKTLFESQFNLALNKLMVEYQNNKIYLGRRSGGTYFAMFFKKVELNQEAILLTLKYTPYVKKYSDEVPVTLMQLFEYSGGLKKTQQRINTTLKFNKGLIPDNLFSYLDNLLIHINRLNFIGYKKYVPACKLPICVLCYREVSPKSKSYCSYHSIKKNYQHDKLKLLAYIKRENGDYLEEIRNYNNKGVRVSPEDLLNYLNTIPVKSHFIDHQKLKELWRQDWQKYAEYMLNITQQYYPLTYAHINNIRINDFTNWITFSQALKLRFDPENYMKPSNAEWLLFENNEHDILYFLTVAARFNLYLKLKDFSPKRGPKKGTVMTNLPLRNNISKLLNHQKLNNKKFNFSEIAKKLGISRQRVSYIIKNDPLISSTQK